MQWIAICKRYSCTEFMWGLGEKLLRIPTGSAATLKQVKEAKISELVRVRVGNLEKIRSE